MAEKGDLPQDAESLPPNYASSDVYTESPPPGYRKNSTVRLQMTRVICLTLLAAGFLTGAFILAHAWVTAPRDACDCGAINLPLHRASFLAAAPPSGDDLSLDSMVSPSVDQPLGDLETLDEGGNSLDAAPETRQMDIPLPLDESEGSVENLHEGRMEAAKGAMEEEVDGLQNILKETQKKVKLPVGLLLGNPALAGKEVNCRVEKKVQNLGAGIISKTIIVTCDDDDDDDDDERPMNSNPFESLLGGSRKAPTPPMSLIAPLLKMMANRATARLQRQRQAKPVMRRFPQGMMHPIIIPLSAIGMQPFSGPFPSRFDGPARPISMSSDFTQGSVPSMFTSMIPLPVNSLSQSNIMPIPFLPPMRVQSLSNIPNMPQRMPFEARLIPIRETEQTLKPFIREITEEKKSSPIKIIRGFPPQMPDALKQIVSQIMGRAARKENGQSRPIITIRRIPEQQSIEGISSSPMSKLVPFPFRIIKMSSPGRSARKLSTREDRPNGPNSAPFPLPRGAMPLHGTPFTPHVVPGATGRALDSPVTIPSLTDLPPLRFFPGQLLRLPVPLPQRRAITHMELKKSPNSFQKNDEKEPLTKESQMPPMAFNTRLEPFDSLATGPDFGPPRHHTLISGPPPMQDNISQESNPLPPFRQELPPPPPPKFAREGRVGIIREINPDAELIKAPANPTEHHMIMVN